MKEWLQIYIYVFNRGFRVEMAMRHDSCESYIFIEEMSYNIITDHWTTSRAISSASYLNGIKIFEDGIKLGIEL